jgi:hypothetical protein
MSAASRVARRAVAPLVLLASCHAAIAAGDDLLSMADALPALPASVGAARGVTDVKALPEGPRLVAPAFETYKLQVKSRVDAAATANNGGTIDVARMQSDAAYAQAMQAKIAAMSPAEKMAFAHTMQGGTGDPMVAGRVAGFLGMQRPADLAAMTKIRDTIEAAMNVASRQHVEADRRFDAQAKACPTDKTGWPLDTCTGPLGDQSIAEHRRIEDGALPGEAQALAQARAIAATELAKARPVLAATPANARGSLAGWAATYATLLGEYADAMTLRAGFWAHADGRHYTGHVQPYIGPGPEPRVTWPLVAPDKARIGLIH